MPSLSTSREAVPALPAASNARASNRSAFPGATGTATGTVARHVPTCGVPLESVAAMPLTLKLASPTTSLACTTTASIEPDTRTSGEGDVISTDGGVVSRTITLNVPVATLPVASAAEQLTSVDPMGKRVPDTGTHETVTASPAALVALTTYDTVAPSTLVASATICAGNARLGGAAGPAAASPANMIVWGEPEASLRISRLAAVEPIAAAR